MEVERENDIFLVNSKARITPVNLTARRSNQSILKEIDPNYSLEEMMLKLQYFGHLMRRRRPTGKDPDTGKD